MKLAYMAAALAAFATTADAGGILGTWESQPSTWGRDKGSYIHVKITACPGDKTKVCGKIIDGFNGTDARRAEVVGKPIIKDMSPSGAGKWSGGVIWAPDMNLNSSKKHSDLVLKGNKLHISGCTIGRVVCREQTWTRLR